MVVEWDGDSYRVHPHTRVEGSVTLSGRRWRGGDRGTGDGGSQTTNTVPETTGVWGTQWGTTTLGAPRHHRRRGRRVRRTTRVLEVVIDNNLVTNDSLVSQRVTLTEK